MAMGMKIEAVFLDRDGTINKRYDYGHIDHPRLVHIDSSVYDAIRMLNEQQIPVYVVTNQQGVGLGTMTQEHLTHVNNAIEQRLHLAGASVSQWYCCTHVAGTCICRKPSPFLLRLAAQSHDHDLSACVMIGDKESDVQAGARAGCYTMRILDPTSDDVLSSRANEFHSSLYNAVQSLLADRWTFTEPEPESEHPAEEGWISGDFFAN